MPNVQAQQFDMKSGLPKESFTKYKLDR